MPHTAEEVAHYSHFLTMQAYGYQAEAYAHSTHHDSARHYLALIESDDFAHTDHGKRVRANVYMALGRYDRALPLYDDLAAGKRTDTVGYDYSSMLLSHAEAAELAGGQGRGAPEQYLRPRGLPPPLAGHLGLPRHDLRPRPAGIRPGGAEPAGIARYGCERGRPLRGTPSKKLRKTKSRYFTISLRTALWHSPTMRTK